MVIACTTDCFHALMYSKARTRDPSLAGSGTRFPRMLKAQDHCEHRLIYKVLPGEICIAGCRYYYDEH